MMRLLARALLVLGALVVTSVAGAAAYAHAAPPTATTCVPSTTYYQTTVADRPDSGLHGNWAHDSFTRTSIVTGCDGAYTLKLRDAGTFTTITGAVSPGAGVALAPQFHGTFTGGATLHVTGASAPHAPTGGTDGTVSSSDWWKLIFDDGVAETTTWGWRYESCGESWTNAATGNVGDVTGLPCAIVPRYVTSVTACDCSPTVAATVTITVRVVGLEWHAPLVVPYTVAGQSGQLALGNHDARKSTVVTLVTHDAHHGKVKVTVGDQVKWVRVRTDCTPPSSSTTTAPPSSSTTTAPVTTTTGQSPPPSTATSSTTHAAPVQHATSGTGGTTGRLAYTGTGGSWLPLLAALGAILVLAGSVVMFRLHVRQRTRREQ